MSSRIPRLALSFALLLLVFCLPLLAAPREERAASGPAGEAREEARSLFGRLVVLIEKAGSYIDPFGGQPSNPPAPPKPSATTQSDAGSYIDPFGNH